MILVEGIPSIVSVRNLTCAYGSEVVLRDVSFDVAKGEVFVIIGRSGCGKSTLFKHLIGLLRPVSGSIIISGHDLIAAELQEFHAILKGIGVMFQTGALFRSMSLLNNIALPLEQFTDLPRDAIEIIARVKLALVGLERYAYHLPSEVSDGMIKRAAIARAMALDPPVLLLDEPSAGLDPVTSAALDAVIRSLAEALGITFIVVSHELSSILAIADRVILLDSQTKGIVAAGDPRALLANSRDRIVRQFFDREARLPKLP